MARPRKDNPLDEFSTGDMTAGSGLSTQNIIQLSKRGLVPDFGNVGMAAHRIGTIDTLKHIAVIGAFHRAGFDPLLSAKLVAPVARELEGNYGGLPSGFDLYLQAPTNPNPGNYLWDHREGDPDSGNDFWFHHLMVTRTDGIHRPGQARGGDFLIEVADRKYVYLDTIQKHADVPLIGGVPYSATPLFRVIGWERGEDAEIVPLHHEADTAEQYFDENPEERERHLRREYLMAHAHAVGRIRVNISLAIRNALDAIHAHRAGR